MDAMKLEWCIDTRKHGIPLAYVKDWVVVCGCTLTQGQADGNFSTLFTRNDMRRTEALVNVVTDRAHVEEHLTSIMIEHKVRLVMKRSTKNRTPSKTSVEYFCHRGGKAARKGSDTQRLRRSKKVGCPFKVVVEYVDGNNKVTIALHNVHDGHDPGTRADLCHLLVHPKVITCCMND